MATKIRRGRSWAYTIKRRALLPRPIYLTFEDEAEGDAYVAHLEQLLDRGIVPEAFLQDRRAPATLSHLIDGYMERVHLPESDERLLVVLSRRIGGLRVEEFNYSRAEKWVSEMRGVLAPSTIRHYVGAMARCIDWHIRHGDSSLLVNPLRQLPRRYATTAEHGDQERSRRLEPGEEAAIRAIMLGAIPDGRERALALRHREALGMLFDLALETAMRLREMFTLDWSQVDVARRTIFLEKTKNGDRRQVPLSSVAADLLRDATAGPVFPWWDGRASTLDKTTSLLSHQFARIFSAAGCDDLRFHDLRHEATCRLFERTAMSDTEIALITGHRDPRMLKRYANLRASHLAGKMW